MPQGSSKGANKTLPNKSAITTSIPPMIADTGNNPWWEAPTNCLPRWGDIKPTKPTAPAVAIEAPAKATLVKSNNPRCHSTNTALAKSPTKSIRSQSNHIFMSIYAAFQLERLKLKHKINHFALRNRIYVRALQQAMCELHLLKSA